MKFINCNQMSLAEDINKIKIRDPMSLHYNTDLEDICVLVYKNIHTNNIETKIIIADTDLNALSFFMITGIVGTNLFVDNELLVILRHDNIKELLKVANTNIFSLKKQLDYVSLSFDITNKNISYNASNDKNELINQSPLFVLETEKLKSIENEFKLIETGKKTEQEISDIHSNNLRWMAPVELNINEIYQEMDLLNFAENMINRFINDLQTIEKPSEKIDMINFSTKLIHNFKKEINEEYEYYKPEDISNYLLIISLGRLEQETIKKANLIHNFYETQREAIFIKIDEMFDTMNNEKNKLINN